MITDMIGKNAGKVWQILNENGEVAFSELITITKLEKRELLLAIGWLAREGKIYHTNPYSKDWKIHLFY